MMIINTSKGTFPIVPADSVMIDRVHVKPILVGLDGERHMVPWLFAKPAFVQALRNGRVVPVRSCSGSLVKVVDQDSLLYMGNPSKCLNGHNVAISGHYSGYVNAWVNAVTRDVFERCTAIVDKFTYFEGNVMVDCGSREAAIATAACLNLFGMHANRIITSGRSTPYCDIDTGLFDDYVGAVYAGFDSDRICVSAYLKEVQLQRTRKGNRVLELSELIQQCLRLEFRFHARNLRENRFFLNVPWDEIDLVGLIRHEMQRMRLAIPRAAVGDLSPYRCRQKDVLTAWMQGVDVASDPSVSYELFKRILDRSGYDIRRRFRDYQEFDFSRPFLGMEQLMDIERWSNAKISQDLGGIISRRGAVDRRFHGRFS